MLPRFRFLLVLLAGLALVAAPAQADLTDGLKKGTPDLKSAGALAFGPDGVLFVGDTQGAALFAIDTGDRTKASAMPLKVDGIDAKIAALLGTDAKGIQINDLRVNPISGTAYLSVHRGIGPNADPVIVRVQGSGKLEQLGLKDVKFAKVTLPNPADAKRRVSTITQIAYIDGRVLIAGLSNEEWASTLRAVPFPFKEADKGAGIGIFHGAHGRFETNSPINTFTPYTINGQSHLLAAYTCTPLVKIPVADLKGGAQVKGTTVAELGNMNRPIDMVVYNRAGKDYLLMANSARGMMKISLDGVDKAESINKRIADKAGLPYETVPNLATVQQMDRLDDNNAVVLIRTGDGVLNLQTIALP